VFPFPAGARNFPFETYRRALGPTQPSIQMITRALSAVVRQPGRETDNSRPSSAEVKND
jgi:hypothetical protein